MLYETTIVQPDIVYIESARLRLVSPRGIEGAPTLAEGAFGFAARLDRGESGSLAPFSDLTIVASSLWP